MKKSKVIGNIVIISFFLLTVVSLWGGVKIDIYPNQATIFSDIKIETTFEMEKTLLSKMFSSKSTEPQPLSLADLTRSDFVVASNDVDSSVHRDTPLPEYLFFPIYTNDKPLFEKLMRLGSKQDTNYKNVKSFAAFLKKKENGKKYKVYGFAIPFRDFIGEPEKYRFDRPIFSFINTETAGELLYKGQYVMEKEKEFYIFVEKERFPVLALTRKPKIQ